MKIIKRILNKRSVIECKIEIEISGVVIDRNIEAKKITRIVVIASNFNGTDIDHVCNVIGLYDTSTQHYQKLHAYITHEVEALTKKAIRKTERIKKIDKAVEVEMIKNFFNIKK